MDPCSAWRLVVDSAVVVTGVAAIIAAVYSAMQAHSTAAVNAATLAGLQAEQARRDDERRYQNWLGAQLVARGVKPFAISRSDMPEADRWMFDRALVERYLENLAGEKFRFILRNANDPKPFLGP